MLGHEVQALSAWFQKKARKLPWRETRDPYAIWISEVMLQQTQVTTVIPYYLKFLARFPTIESLATAAETEVLALWSGLGYYSRARNLHKGAKYLRDLGYFPKLREQALEIPGIGPYTAGAILSISFNLPVPLVDGNVQRVFARYYGLKQIITDKKAQAFFWDKAQKWVEAAKSPRILNQAVMELGATICTKGTPKCEVCPLAAACVAKKANLQNKLPRKKPRRKMEELHWVGLLVQHSNRLLLKRNAKGDWWEGLWDFPRWEEVRDERFPREKLRKKYARANRIKELNAVRHTVTHHKINVTPFWIELPKQTLAPEGSKWVELGDIAALPLSSLAKKLISQLPQN